MHCYAFCPANAITVSGLGQLPQKKNPDTDSFLSLLINRKSYPRFLDKSVSNENIEQLAKAVALMAGTLRLGSCFVSLSQQVVSNNKSCREILSIPQSHRVEAVVIVGHPKRIYQLPALRKPKRVNFQ